MMVTLFRSLACLSVICAVVLPVSSEGSVESYPTSSLTTSVTLSGPLAYVGDGSSGIKIIDLNQPGFPIIGSYNTPGFVHDIVIRNNLLYVADGGNGLLILDVSVPEVVVPRGRYATSGMAKAIALSDDFAYVADYAYGFQVIDVSEPSSPTYVAHSFDLGDVWALTVGPDGYLYIADVGNGIRIWDIHRPSEPAEIGHVNTPGYALDMGVKDGFSFVADGWNGLLVYDVTSPQNAVLVAKSDTADYAFGVSLLESFMYLSEGYAGLRIFDISSQHDLPKKTGEYNTDGQTLDASAYEGTVVVADGHAGTKIIRDLVPPGKVTSLASFPDKETWFSDVSITVTWAAADDLGTGVAGYSIVWDTNPDTQPDTTQDIGPVTTVTNDSLSQGPDHYFHIRAVDNAGNWGDAEHWGPFYVGTAPTFKEVIPHANAGIHDNVRVSKNASFCVRVENANGIDMTNTENIGFMISDGTDTYERDLSDTGVVRWVKLSDENDSRVTHLWAVYDRSREEFGSYPYDSDISVAIAVNDTLQESLTRAVFVFHVETERQHDEALADSPETAPLSAGDPDLGGYDTGIEAIDAGLLKGGKIVYRSTEPVEPAFGPTYEIPELDLPNVEPVGTPLNLQPPTVLNTPVKVLLPCPGHDDVSNLVVCFFNGVSWQLACDANGSVTSEAEAWMVPGSRVNHPDSNPPRVEIKVYHFTAVEAAHPSGSPSGDSGGGGGCFVTASVCDRWPPPVLARLLYSAPFSNAQKVFRGPHEKR